MCSPLQGEDGIHISVICHEPNGNPGGKNKDSLHAMHAACCNDLLIFNVLSLVEVTHP
jgi:hypothetical protein